MPQSDHGGSAHDAAATALTKEKLAPHEPGGFPSALQPSAFAIVTASRFLHLRCERLPWPLTWQDAIGLDLVEKWRVRSIIGKRYRLRGVASGSWDLFTIARRALVAMEPRSSV
eukprot:scaffold273796_cov31-Tisochrysis_lutea.AAC.1